MQDEEEYSSEEEFEPRPPVKKGNRTKKNILITGSPGTGKTCLLCSCFFGYNVHAKHVALCEALVQRLQGYTHIAISQFALDHKFVEEYDEERQTYVLDEDKILDYIEDVLHIDNNGGFIIEYHSSEWFPERWFDLVVCLHASTEKMHDRLAKRSYSKAKIEENVQCEIMRICADEALASYTEDIVWELQSDTVQEMEQNIQKIMDFVNKI